jgi:hypothetical protein
VCYIFLGQPTHDYRVTCRHDPSGPMKMPMNPIVNKPPIIPIKMIQSGTPAPRPIKSGLIKFSGQPMHRSKCNSHQRLPPEHPEKRLRNPKTGKNDSA